MSVRAALVVRWFLRLLLFAAVYTLGAAFIVSTATGWDGLRFLGASFAFATVLLPSWCGAIALEHSFIPNLRHRLWLHPAIVMTLFAVAAFVVNDIFFGDPRESIWRDMKPFAPWILAAAFFDAALDLLLARKLAAAPAA
jgi:hypothetical protein